MSDMPRPRPLPPAPDHERHDVLLVAQLSAGDPLDSEQHAEAQRLVAGCGACAGLAADLRVVSAAVATEPVPPRRRDFRLSPEQAEDLSGNALTRFLGRLSLPTSRAFQPAAAGVLSIGLLFVVAGYAWPDGASVTVQAEPNLATYGETTEAPAPVEEPAAPLVGDQAFDEAAGDDAAEGALLDPDFLESLPEHQAGTSERALQKSTVSDADAQELDQLELELAPLQAPATTAAEGLSDAVADDGRRNALAAPAAEADAAAEEVADDLALDAAAPALERDGVDTGEATTATVLSDLSSDGSDPEDLLIVLGLLLVLGGGGLLLLGWLVRRSSDPLLR